MPCWIFKLPSSSLLLFYLCLIFAEVTMGFKYDKAKDCSMRHRYKYLCNKFPLSITQQWRISAQKISIGVQEQTLLFPFGCPWLAGWCLLHPLMDTHGGLCRRTSLCSSQLHTSWLTLLPTTGARALAHLGGVTLAQVLGEQGKAQGNAVPGQLGIDWVC